MKEGRNEGHFISPQCFASVQKLNKKGDQDLPVNTK
jgi:hypothetical protein